MIIENGFLEVKTKTGGGLDPVTHMPIAVSVSWGETIPCQIREVKYDNLANASGNDYIQSSYTILTEQDFEGEVIRLTGNGICKEYSIIRKTALAEVGLIRITV